MFVFHSVWLFSALHFDCPALLSLLDLLPLPGFDHEFVCDLDCLCFVTLMLKLPFWLGWWVQNGTHKFLHIFPHSEMISIIQAIYLMNNNFASMPNINWMTKSGNHTIIIHGHVLRKHFVSWPPIQTLSLKHLYFYLFSIYFLFLFSLHLFSKTRDIKLPCTVT